MSGSGARGPRAGRAGGRHGPGPGAEPPRAAARRATETGAGGRPADLAEGPTEGDAQAGGKGARRTGEGPEANPTEANPAEPNPAAERLTAADLLAPVLRPVPTGSGFEAALEQLLQIVRLGLVRGGERLPPERELAGLLGVSRVTLREVLKVLKEQGLIRSRRGRHGGTFVSPGARAAGARATGEQELRRRIGAGDIEDVLRFRAVLETGAVELCAARDLTGTDAERLRTALARTHDAPLPDYRRQDTLLHLTLAELSGSPTLSVQYAAVRATLNTLLDRIPLLVRNLEHAQRQHTAVVRAVLAGDVDGARAVMREHCAGTAALLRGFLA